MMVLNCGPPVARPLERTFGSEDTLKIRIASSLALAAAIALGASGCSLIAPQGTVEPYAPSDGVDVSIVTMSADTSETVADSEVDAQAVDLRNFMLIADESGENFNVVFSAVNRTGEPQRVLINFLGGDEGSSASATFEIPEGNTEFGNPEGEAPITLVTLPGLKAGDMARAYLELGSATSKTEYRWLGCDSVTEQEGCNYVPVLDGTLKEYKQYVIGSDFKQVAGKDDSKPSTTTVEDDEASQSKVGDDIPAEEKSE